MTHPNHLQDSGADVRHVTPAQFAAHKAHVARQHRIRSARIVDPPPVEPVPEPPPEPTPAPRSQWWFCIVGETGIPGRQITAADIKRAVADHFKISVIELISDRRFVKVILARQIGMYVAKEMTSLSSPQIGRYFGGRDHTTILSGIKKIERLLKTDEDLAATINTIRESIAGTK